MFMSSSSANLSIVVSMATNVPVRPAPALGRNERLQELCVSFIEDTLYSCWVTTDFKCSVTIFNLIILCH